MTEEWYDAKMPAESADFHLAHVITNPVSLLHDDDLFLCRFSVTTSTKQKYHSRYSALHNVSSRRR